MPRAKPLYPQAVDEAIPALVSSLEEGDSHRITVQAVVRAYLAVAVDLETKRIDGRISDLTRRISRMIVHASIEVPASPLQSIRQRFRLARELSEIPDARWTCKTLPTGYIRITRIADGGNVVERDPLRNPKVRELVNMRVGEVILSKTLKTTRGSGQMGSNTKIQARKYLKKPDADWTVKSAGNGVRIMRIR